VCVCVRESCVEERERVCVCVCVCVCVYEGVEKTFVRFYDFLFYFACSEIRGTFRGSFGQYLTLAIMCYKKGRCRVPWCARTPKVMCKNCNIHHNFTAEKNCFLKFRRE